MADPNAILQVLRDPNLQTGPFPQWPTLPPMRQPQPHYLENDPTAWEGGDFPTHVDPMSIAMALMAGKSGMKGSPPPLTPERVISAATKFGTDVFPSTVHGLEDWDAAHAKFGTPAVDEMFRNNQVIPGFSTTLRPFVTREEALNIVKMLQPDYQRANKSGVPGLHSHDLDKIK